MAGRYLTPISGRFFGACTAAWLLASLPGSQALASSNVPPSCDDEASIALEIPASQLHVSDINREFEAKNAAGQRSEEDESLVSPARFFTPEAKATLQQAFDKGTETVVEPTPDKEPVVESDEQPTIKARVPGVSDGELARYKRHMYRRDI